MGQLQAGISDILAQHKLFKDLSADDLEQLAARTKVRRYKRNETVFAMGDRGDSMMAVLSGKIRIKLYSAEGKEVVVAIFGPGAIFGEIAMIDGGERTADADAIDTTELMVLERRDFLPFVERHPKVAVRLLEIMCERFRDVDKKIIDLITLPVPARIAKCLGALADLYGTPTANGVLIEVNLPHRVLADMNNATRESACNAVKALKVAGAIKQLKPGQIFIVDRDKLDHFGENGLSPDVN